MNCNSTKQECKSTNNKYCRYLSNDLLTVNWTFDDGESREGSWSELSKTLKYYEELGNHSAKLTIKSNPETSITTEFDIYLTDYSCIDEGVSWRLQNGTIISSLDNCNLPEIDSSCCPLGYICDDSTNTCVENNSFICFNYHNRENCESYSDTVAKYSVELKTDKKCGSSTWNIETGCSEIITDCACSWNVSECIANYSLLEYCDEDGASSAIKLGECLFYDEESTECENGIMTITWSAIWTGDESDRPLECQGGSQTVSCSPEVRVNFFTFINIIISIILLGLIYLKKIKTGKNLTES